MIRYIRSDELYHFGRSKADGAPGIGTGNWRRGRKLYKYADGSLTPEGVRKYRKAEKAYGKALIKYTIANPAGKWDGYHVTPNWWDFIKPKYEEIKKGNQTIQKYELKARSLVNSPYGEPLKKYLIAKKNLKNAAAKIHKITGLSPEESFERYSKKATVDPEYAEKLINDAASRYIANYINTPKSQIKSYKMGINDLEKLFPNGTGTFNAELALYIAKLEQENGGKLYK